MLSRQNTQSQDAAQELQKKFPALLNPALQHPLPETPALSEVQLLPQAKNYPPASPHSPVPELSRPLSRGRKSGGKRRSSRRIVREHRRHWEVFLCSSHPTHPGMSFTLLLCAQSREPQSPWECASTGRRSARSLKERGWAGFPAPAASSAGTRLVGGADFRAGRTVSLAGDKLAWMLVSLWLPNSQSNGFLPVPATRQAVLS